MIDETLPLGVLDLSKRLGGRSTQALADTIELAVAAEVAGYRRFWVAEHHVPDASHASPEILVAAIGARTTRLRVGSGGVLLRYYSPLKVAEVFHALEALFPGRVDLGVAQGPGVVDDAVAAALVTGNLWELDSSVFARKTFELAELLHQSDDAGCRVRPQPSDVPSPPLWVLGSGARSAELAVRLQRPYAVAAFPLGRAHDVSAVTAVYLAGTADAEKRALAVAVSVTVDETTARAEARDAANVRNGYLAANLVGDPETVAAALHDVRERTRADELLLTTLAGPHELWRAALAPLASAWRRDAALARS